MVSRGYTGRMPAVWQGAGAATAGQWAVAATVPVAAAAIAAAARRADMIGYVQTAPSLDVRGVRYAYPDGHVALHRVDLTVPRGERVALLGPNGAGKTTLVLHLNGILTADRRHGRPSAG